MAKLLSNFVWVVMAAVLGMSVAQANDDKCQTEKLKAFKQHSACISTATIVGIKQDATNEDIQEWINFCGDQLVEDFESAEDKAMHLGRQCPTVGDAEAIHADVLTACCPLCGCEE